MIKKLFNLSLIAPLSLLAFVSVLGFVFVAPKESLANNGDITAGETVNLDINFTSTQDIAGVEYRVSVSNGTLESINCDNLDAGFSNFTPPNLSNGCSLGYGEGNSKGGKIGSIIVKAGNNISEKLQVTINGDFSNFRGDVVSGNIPGFEFTVVDSNNPSQPSFDVSYIDSVPVNLDETKSYDINFESNELVDAVTLSVNVTGGEVVRLNCTDSDFSNVASTSTECSLAKSGDGITSGKIASVTVRFTSVGQAQVTPVFTTGGGSGYVSATAYGYNVTVNGSSSNTHLACVNNACVEVSGGGANECSRSADCQGGTSQQVICDELSGFANDTSGKTILINEIPDDFVGTVTLNCDGRSRPDPINEMTFTLTKTDLEGNSTTQTKTIVANTDVLGKYIAGDIVISECNDTERQKGFTCSFGTATFNIEGAGDYSASSKVCVVEGDIKTCSP